MRFDVCMYMRSLCYTRCFSVINNGVGCWIAHSVWCAQGLLGALSILYSWLIANKTFNHALSNQAFKVPSWSSIQVILLYTSSSKATGGSGDCYLCSVCYELHAGLWWLSKEYFWFLSFPEKVYAQLPDNRSGTAEAHVITNQALLKMVPGSLRLSSDQKEWV